MKAVEAARNIYAVYKDNAIGESTARKWFSRFKEDRFDISDIPRSGRSSGFDEDRLNISIHNDPHQSTGELANVMNSGHSTIVQHLHSMGKIQKSGVCLHRMLKAKITQISGWSYMHLCLLVIDRVGKNIT